MKVLGISGSGRINGYSTKIIKDILGKINHETEFISLSGKKINGCIGCLKCVHDNKCVQNDDFDEILDKVIKADVLIFAGPNYYASLNAISLAFWERTFCLRHREKFLLAGKLGVAIGLDRTENGPALQHIVRMMKSNKMAVIDSFSNPGNYQCYDCGVGHTCVVGNVYPRQGLCTKEYAEANRPIEYNKDLESKNKIMGIGKLINSILDARSNNLKK